MASIFGKDIASKGLVFISPVQSSLKVRNVFSLVWLNSSDAQPTVLIAYRHNLGGSCL